MDPLSSIIALVAGLYEMVPWRGILISIGIVCGSTRRTCALTYWAASSTSWAKLDGLEEKLDDTSRRTRPTIEDETSGEMLNRHPVQEAAIEAGVQRQWTVVTCYFSRAVGQSLINFYGGYRLIILQELEHYS